MERCPLRQVLLYTNATPRCHSCVCSQIGYMCGELQAEFDSMDPYNTGCVSHEEYREVLQELCVHLNEYELEMLSNKFRTADDR